jgi:hypothetical protein
VSLRENEINIPDVYGASLNLQSNSIWLQFVKVTKKDTINRHKAGNRKIFALPLKIVVKWNVRELLDERIS